MDKKELDQEALRQEANDFRADLMEKARKAIKERILSELPVSIGSIQKEICLLGFINMKITGAFLDGMYLLGKELSSDFDLEEDEEDDPVDEKS